MTENTSCSSKTGKDILGRIIDLYVQGIRSMRLGRTLWKIIAIKVFIIFFIFKLFFFPDMLNRAFDTDSEKAEHVLQVLTLQNQDEEIHQPSGDTGQKAGAMKKKPGPDAHGHPRVSDSNILSFQDKNHT